MAGQRRPIVAVLVGAITGVLVVAGATAVWLLWPSGEPAAEPLPDTVVVRTIDDPGEADHARAAAAVIAALPEQFAAGDASALTDEARAAFGDVREALPA